MLDELVISPMLHKVTGDAEGFAGETCAVNVLEGGERDTNDLLSCSHYAWRVLRQDALQAPYHTVMQLVRMPLDGASVEGAHDGGRGSGSSQFAEESRDAAVLSWLVLQCC